MAPFTALPDDILVEILLLADSPGDLVCAISAIRGFYDAYSRHRPAIIRSVTHRTLLSSGLVVDGVLDRAMRMKLRTHGNSADMIAILEGIQPIMLKWNDDARKAFEWATKLLRLYRKAGDDSSQRKSLNLAETLYPSILGVQKKFVLNPDEQRHTGLMRSLSRSEKEVCRELCLCYTTLGRVEQHLEVQKEVLQRLSLNETDSNIWGCDMVSTLRTLGRSDEALHIERRLYELCKSRNGSHQEAALRWGRHIITEYTLAGDEQTALATQALFLADLTPGSNEYIAWARQLIVMQKRAGLVQDALAMKRTVWEHLQPRSSCYFGWSRELADDYRRLNRRQDAQDVVQAMCEGAQAQLKRYPKDIGLQFHAESASRALQIEVGPGGARSA